MHASKTDPRQRSKKYAAQAELHGLGESDITAERRRSGILRWRVCFCRRRLRTVIPDEFLSGSSLTRLDLSAVSCVMEVGDRFLDNVDKKKHRHVRVEQLDAHR